MNRSRRATAAGVVLAAAMSVTACSSDTSSGSEGSTTATSAEAKDAAARVEAASAPVDEFVAPGSAIPEVATLSGGVVYYIPALAQVPLLKQIADSLTAALDTVGVELRVCDGKANPQDAANCLGQAIDADADAVVVGGIADEYAPVAFKAVRDAGIPLVYSGTDLAPTDDPTKVSYITPDYVEMQSLNADWVIADSDAKAHVLVVKATDTPGAIAWVEIGALGTYDKKCPDCEVKVVETNFAQIDKLPSLVSAALVADPAIDYVQVAFDDRVQPTLQGIQASGRTDVAVVSQNGQLDVMQNLADGNFLAADVGFDAQAFAWYVADRVLRMMAGQAADTYTFPIRRIFTRGSAEKLTLSPEAEASGEWYGTSDYQTGLKQLWGLA